MDHINWKVVNARVLTIAGFFVTGGVAAGLLPHSWQHPAAVIAGIVIAALSISPDVRTSHKA